MPRQSNQANDRLRASKRDPLAQAWADPSIDSLSTELRYRIGRQWAERASAELRVGCVFTVVARGLFEFGAEPSVLRIAARAVSDEVRHAEICRRLAERYLGHPVDWPGPRLARMPHLAHVPKDLRATLHAVAMGCINETIASAWLEASLRDAASPLARGAIRELIADDIQHARLGWAHVASPFVSKKMRGELGAWLPHLLEAAAWTWTRKGKHVWAEGFPPHGVPSLAKTREVVRETVRTVVLPGFETLGVPTSSAREWWSREFDD